MFPGITIDDLYKKEHKSIIRNKLIDQVFYDIRYIEKYGSGTIKIVDLCKRHGLPSPEFKEIFGGFTVVFRKDIYTEEYLHNLGLNEPQIKAVIPPTGLYSGGRDCILRRMYLWALKGLGLKDTVIFCWWLSCPISAITDVKNHMDTNESYSTDCYKLMRMAI